ncbi:MAG: 7-cyano-7-deazaguanine synthase QueC [Campylobacteraceae bacterium]|nr:7-cyano-7-deazaguanine synthase QueC [Campylobacteraceae bacterium]
MKKAVCIISGGMDSALAAFRAKKDGNEIIALHFNYGQRTQKKELECFEKIADVLGAKKVVLDTSFIKNTSSSSLTDRTLHVRTSGLEEGVPNTYVPYRNGIFISIAASLAEKEGAQSLYLGVMEEDSSGYPDCTEDFIKKIEDAVNEGTKKETNIKIHTPLVHLTKSDIVKEALLLDVPLELTWSCYVNEDEACGVCDSCRLRLRGFKNANAVDKIPYVKN